MKLRSTVASVSRGLLLPLFWVASLSLASPATACLCSPEATPKLAFDGVDAVFTGRVEAASFHLLSPMRVVRMSVDRSWKGASAATVWIATPYGGGLCGFDFAVGREYLIYAREVDSRFPYPVTESGTYYTTDVCGRTQLVIDADEDLDFLGRASQRFDETRRQAPSRFVEYTFDRFNRGLTWDRDRVLVQAAAGRRDALGQTPLMLAALTDDLRLVEAVLAAGSESNITGPLGGTALMIAAWTGNPRIVGLLIEAGAAVDQAIPHELPPLDQGVTALSIAARSGRNAAIDELVGGGADLEGSPNADRTPLMEAVLGRHLEVVRQLIELGADLDAVDENGQTALDLSADRRPLEIAEALRAAAAVRDSRRNDLGH